MIVDDLLSEMRIANRSKDRVRNHELASARDAVVAFATCPLPSCRCGMLRMGEKFWPWSPRCLDGGPHVAPTIQRLHVDDLREAELSASVTFTYDDPVSHEHVKRLAYARVSVLAFLGAR